MKKCPANPEEHNEFIVSAHVVEEWLVDSEGNWIETTGTLETLRGPDENDYWVCAECFVEAVEVDDDDTG